MNHARGLGKTFTHAAGLICGVKTLTSAQNALSIPDGMGLKMRSLVLNVMERENNNTNLLPMTNHHLPSAEEILDKHKIVRYRALFITVMTDFAHSLLAEKEEENRVLRAEIKLQKIELDLLYEAQIDKENKRTD